MSKTYPHEFTKTPFYKVDGKRYYVLATAEGYEATGVASWYGPNFDGQRTSDGDRYDMYAMTAAHKTLPLPCYVRVTNLANGRSIVVKVNDRGPFVANRHDPARQMPPPAHRAPRVGSPRHA